MEWIVLVAAVGGIATGVSIIIFNLVSDESGQENAHTRLERIAQQEVDEVMRTDEDGNPVGTYNNGKSIKVSNSDITRRCDINYSRNDRSQPLLKWRGKVALYYLEASPGGTAIEGSGEIQGEGHYMNTEDSWENATAWCDVITIPRQGQPRIVNNVVGAFSGNPRTNRSGTVTWPDLANTP